MTSSCNCFLREETESRCTGPTARALATSELSQLQMRALLREWEAETDMCDVEKILGYCDDLSPRQAPPNYYPDSNFARAAVR